MTRLLNAYNHNSAPAIHNYIIEQKARAFIMADESPTGSPLSILSSDAFEADEEHERRAAEALMPPAKRQKRGDSSLRATPTAPHIEDDALSSISSDTDGEVPNSPSNLRPEDDDTHDQVTVCIWEGCDAGDLGDMDRLVDHIHAEHIETRQKKYTCEWTDCTRKSLPHASGYALKAHMRSHTREKPFYCALPGKFCSGVLNNSTKYNVECDRAFTRSDALAKHMRTVHETEALRPSDPIPKSMQPAIKASRLKLIIKAPQSHIEEHHPEVTNGATNGKEITGWTSSYPAELGFTAEEEARGPKELYRLLRRQLHWAEEEATSLKRSCEVMEELRRKEWIEKEILLDQAIKTDVSWNERRREVLAGLADLPTSAAIKAAADKTWTQAYSPQGGSAMSPSPMPTKAPEDQREAAAVLASLHQA